MSKVAIVTLGCPKNAIDSEGLGGLLAAGGHEVTETTEGADVVVVNTCGFIDPARRETVEEVLEFAELKQSGALKGLVLTGCLVARSADELADSLPEVDALVDFAAYPQVSDIVTSAAAGTLDHKVWGDPGTRFDPAWWDAAIAAAPRIRFGRAPWAYLKIAEGCDRGCTFCAIPLMRGKFRSRSMGTIETEARHLASHGVTELSLVSQDSVQWGRDTDEGSFADLLRRLEKVDGIKRLRLMYLHPQGVTDELVDTILGSDVITSYFDLSLQHVAPSVLKAMGRWGGRERFEKTIGRIRAADPLAGVRSTFILGFPGETDSDADEVESFVTDNDIDWIGTFTYSREEGTRSHDLDEQIPADVARERAERVRVAAEQTMERRAESLIGTSLEVLVERFDIQENSWTGRSKREAPEIDGEITFSTTGDLSVGNYVDVTITGTEGTDLVGNADRLTGPVAKPVSA
ncbi:MAG: ribosomal protein methylthiotransferase [Actinomycetota bacterium]|jgi:ribosomal protein S12 methylthiotransferase|nr:ribosomal protein methylthiotransferase [Actinomycetota bacterium]